ncbi:hypothetical protein BXZ70DRAFT_509055 [Cristinia sonorae]|uniref:Uncharacterized protein n=1 Tax=Cristinia sonorae TaxID=1940300 RepID=A0A8K0UV98_9AGAR|nr:hypothetical protein BXZ70DRAFT_509055 [Cristinia sonorae]
MSSRKRKHLPKYREQQQQHHPTVLAPSSDLFIQAYEADILTGPSALISAKSLEVEVLPSGAKRAGDALVRWNLRGAGPGGVDVGEDGKVVVGEGDGVWVDRYDARLLLDALPTLSQHQAQPERSSSPTGWTDLPSDAEDTFFLTPEETEDYRRDKRRKVLDGLRDARMRALQEEEDAEAGTHNTPKDDDRWGGSDEEPDDTQTELMRRTATHLLTSPNPAQLEMRILANHGADPRFAFLRGRWARKWRLLKVRARVEHDNQQQKEKEKGMGALGGLAGYGDSDSEEEGGEGGEGEREKGGTLGKMTAVVSGGEGKDEEDEAMKAARRARAKEWAEKRRMAKS